MLISSINRARDGLLVVEDVPGPSARGSEGTDQLAEKSTAILIRKTADAPPRNLRRRPIRSFDPSHPVTRPIRPDGTDW